MTLGQFIKRKRCSHGAVRRPQTVAPVNDDAPQGRGYNITREMNARTPQLLFALVVACVFICSPEAFAGNNNGNQTGQNTTWKQSAAPVQTPAQNKTNTGKTQTGKTSKGKTNTGKSYHKGKDRSAGHSSHTEVGIGANVDLGGIGQRRPEADPFAIPTGRQPVAAHTEQKPKAPGKKPTEVATSNPFSHVELTGPRAKGESNP
jgi:hypothetical protein